jgi:hypothetical protein
VLLVGLRRPQEGELGYQITVGVCAKPVETLDLRVKGAHIPDRGPDQGFPSGPVRLVRNPETVPMTANGSFVRSGKT